MGLKNKQIYFVLLFAGIFTFFVSEIKAEITIHILHPWADDTARVNYGLFFQYSGDWFPGTAMKQEKADWFYITIPTPKPDQASYFRIASFETTEHNPQDSQVTYTGGRGASGILYKTILAGMPPDSNVYIYVDNLSKEPRIEYVPPKSKVIKFFNPWNVGAPRLVLKGNKTPIRIRYLPELCGWFSYYHTRPDSLILYFSNAREPTQTFGDKGINDNTYIDLSGKFINSDTLWILSSTNPGQPPQISEQFPGRVGNCAPITLAAKLKDVGNNPDFGGSLCESTQSEHRSAVKGMVTKKLGADGKPVTAATPPCNITVEDWFATEKLSGDYTNEQCYNLVLHKNEDGLYEYDDKLFFPLDDFKYLDAAKKIPNPNYTTARGDDSLEHNFHFTMELACEFEYVKGQTFYFRGDDDVWVYIDSQLVVDLGGLHQAVSDSVDLDKLGLKEKSTYSFKLFFTERKPSASNFRVVTSINLRTNSKLFSTETSVGGKGIKYDMFEKVTQGQLACDVSVIPTDTIKAVVDFIIEGPSFPSPEKLPSGTKYTGITVASDYTQIIINPDSITQLETGTYTITYQSASDPSQSSQIVFQVTKPPKPLRPQNPVVKAVILAENGYGKADKVEVYFKDTLDKTPDSILISWPSLQDKKAFSGAALVRDPSNRKHLTVNVSGMFETQFTTFSGTDSLGKSFSVDTSYRNPLLTYTFKINDSIGPIIQSAQYLERQIPAPDTFLLTFSEVLDEATLVGKSLLLIKRDTSVALNVLRVEPGASGTTKVITEQNSSIVPSPGDSLRFFPGGPVTDEYKVHPHDANRPVVIAIHGKPPIITGSWYTDVNADGKIDMVVMSFNKDVLPERIKGTFNIKSDTARCSGPKVAYTGNEKSKLTFDIRDGFNSKIITSGTMNAQIEFVDFPDAKANTPVNDSASPVIMNALFTEGLISSDGTVAETLTIEYSEPVASTQFAEPFNFIIDPKLNESYSLQLKELSRINSKTSFLVLSVTGNGYPSKTDSIFINPAAGLKDEQNNIQANDKNRRVLLSVRTIPLDFNCTAGPSPFIPGQDKINIFVDPKVKVRNEISIAATIFIFDQLGNCVNTMTVDQSNKAISFVWSGCNSKGRFVGTGTYLLIAKMTDLKAGRTEIQQLKIGAIKKKE